MKLLKEQSKSGLKAFSVPSTQIEENTQATIPQDQLRTSLNLPELSELDIIRHYTNLSNLNFGVDTGFYPLGSCTMKYNPKINEELAQIPEFNIHPLSNNHQGNLQIIHELENFLSEITGFAAFSAQPVAGAHGELTGLMIMKAFFEAKGEKRTQILVPDSAHGTNPASAALCGFEIIQIKSNSEGLVDLDDLTSKLNPQVAGLMLTNPNTLGLFDKNILQITQLIHNHGGLCYMDGANLNAMLGIVKPADLGFDLMHINLHKTFATPHGGGGPGAGPVGVIAKLADFLPSPHIIKKANRYEFTNSPQSIGKVHSFYGNFNVLIKAYAYIRTLSALGLQRVAQNAVLNANYMKDQLKKHFHLTHDRICQHEFVLDDSQLPNHVTTNDVAKRLIDYGFHPPTIYFPLIIHGSMMIEPTETENIETMDSFIEALIKIKQEATEQPELVKNAPLTTKIKKLDGVLAARKPILTW